MILFFILLFASSVALAYVRPASGAWNNAPTRKYLRLPEKPWTRICTVGWLTSSLLELKHDPANKQCDLRSQV